jgi:hypothetical protein
VLDPCIQVRPKISSTGSTVGKGRVVEVEKGSSRMTGIREGMSGEKGIIRMT